MKPAIEPVPLGTESVLGILVDSESTIKDFDKKADVSQWNICDDDDLAQL